MAVAAAASSLAFGASFCHSCHSEGICCSRKHWINNSWIKSPVDSRGSPDVLAANTSALLVFPGKIHCEPHEQITWADFQYVIDDYGVEVVESEGFDLLEWEIPDASSLIHPIYFAKCLTKAVNISYERKMDHPSNGVSILGCLIPAFADEEFYVRRLFHNEDSDYYNSDAEGYI